jgi:replicative DNA helicase
MTEPVSPHSLNLERAVLGCALLGPDFALQVVTLDQSYFHDRRHAALFAAMQLDIRAGLPLDVLRLAERLVQVSASDLSSLVDALPMYPQLDHYISDLRALKQKREIAQLCGNARHEALEGPRNPDEVLGLLRRGVEEIASCGGVKRAEPIGLSLPATLADAYAGKVRQGLSTGYSDLDLYLRPEPGELIVLAGYTSHGKSVTVQQVYTSAAMDGSPAAVFSLEMTKKELSVRILSAQSGVPYKAIWKGQMSPFDKRAVETSAQVVARAPIYIDDASGLRFEDIASRATALKRQVGGLGVVVVDHLQLMQQRRGAENENVGYSEITRSLKGLAKNLEVPVWLLSQLRRSADKRTNPRPRLADLRGSGAIEQDADAVVFIYRPVKGEEDGQEVLSEDGELIVAKNRNGELGSIPIRAQLNRMRIVQKDRVHA